MLETILNWINLKKEIPEAIGYRSLGPIEFPIPNELVSISTDEDIVPLPEVSVLFFEMDNYSSKLVRNIRIFYSGVFQYSPQISYVSRGVDVEFELREDKKEIYIKELPPNESLSISFFNVCEEFKVGSVLVGEQMITSTMNKLAQFRSYPSFKWLYLFMFCVLALSFGVVGYSLHTMSGRSEINQMMSEAYKNLGYMECQPYVFDNPIGNEKKLERKYQQLPTIQQENTLILNNVLTYDKLKVKDKILFCVPEQS